MKSDRPGFKVWCIIYCSLFLFACIPGIFAQQKVILHLNSQDSTPVFFAGNINSWNPSDPGYKFSRSTEGLSLSFQTDQKTLEFKLTLGSWTRVEKNANGIDIANRRLDLKPGDNVYHLKVEKWGSGELPVSSKSPQVQILSDSFFMTALNAYRRIWVYLPEDYDTDSLNSYPVWYMHDGQNLFDNRTSFSGEWHVDEFLDNISDLSTSKAIIVGIDNGGIERMNEYSPWKNEKYQSTAKGHAYIDFIVKELKPHIDSAFRTLPCREFTNIGGSSMGGLISLYGLLSRQEVFGNALVFSPAFWVVKSDLESYVKSTEIKYPSRIYFLAGKLEGPEVEADMRVIDSLLSRSDKIQTHLKVEKLGKHNEQFWEKEFSEAYQYLSHSAQSMLSVSEDKLTATGRPCAGSVITYTIPDYLLPASMDIRGGKVLNRDFNKQGKVTVEWLPGAPETSLIIQKGRKK